MRNARIVAVLGAFVLALGLFSAVALGGKKKNTSVIVNSGPVLNGEQNVKVSGSLNTATACRNARAMRLFLTDQDGVILATIDSASSRSAGTWKLQAKLASPPTSDQFLQVKAKKLTVGKYVCKAGLSKLIPIK